MTEDRPEKVLASMALVGVAALASIGGVDDSGGAREPLPPRRPKHRCHDPRKRRKSRMAKESRRRNRR